MRFLPILLLCSLPFFAVPLSGSPGPTDRNADLCRMTRAVAHQLRDIIAEGDHPDRLEAVLGDRHLKHSKVNRYLSSAIVHNRPQSFIFLFHHTVFNLKTYDSTLTSYLCYAISQHAVDIYNFLLTVSFNLQI